MPDTGEWLGQVLEDRYQVTARIGSGGMAHIYKARQRKLERDVVIKVPRPAMLKNPDFAARFTREIRSLVRLRHPFIVPILDVGEHQGVPFMVLDYLPGGSLRERLKRSGPQTPQQLRAWLEGVAAALDCCHQSDCLHRDVKPDNILFDAHGHAALSDFGIVKVLATLAPRQPTVLTGIGQVAGTPQYMAPELIMGGKIDGRVDQYALAVTVFEALTGKLPINAPSKEALYVAQVTAAPEALDAGFGALTGVLAKALAKEPRLRYASCAEFASAVLVAADVVGAPAETRARTVRAAAAGHVASPVAEPVLPHSEPQNRQAPVADTAGLQVSETFPSLSGPEPSTHQPASEKLQAEAKTEKPSIRVMLVAAALVLLVGVLLWRTDVGEGVLVVQVNEPNPDVYVDGKRVTVSWRDGGKKAEIRIKPGTRKVEVKKDGFAVFDQQVDLSEGGRLVVLARLVAQPGNAVTGARVASADDKKDEGWVQLFNGKDLTGWKGLLKTKGKGEGNWSVKEGILVGVGRSNFGHLFSERGDYENFHFRIEAKINDKGNSGQYFRAQIGKSIPKGYEAQINSTHDDPQKTGSLYGLAKVTEMLVPPDTWFTQEVIADGNRIIIKVNGKKVVDYVDAKNTYTRGHFGIHAGNAQETKKKGEKGAVAGASIVSVKKIEVKELSGKKSPGASTSDAK